MQDQAQASFPPPSPSHDSLDRALRALISVSVRHRVVGLIGVGLVLLLGVWAAGRLQLDVTPDISTVQVQVLTAVPALSAEETETSVSRPIELEMFGLPGLEQIRSLTRFGISQVILTFADGTDLYHVRQLVGERLAQVADQLPKGLIPKLAPPSTGLGEIYTFALAYKPGETPKDASDEERLRRLKTAEEFVVRPLLRSVKGVADVNTTGGFDRQLVVTVDPRKLNPQSIDLNDVAMAVERNAAIGGGALLEQGGNQVAARSLARAQTPDEIRAICARFSWGGAVIAVDSIATVGPGSGIRLGAATMNGEEAVLGTVLMLPGENALTVAKAVGRAVAEAQDRLPPGMMLRPLYDRSELIDDVIGTVRTNLAVAALLVSGVLLLFLGDWKAALIVTSTLLLAFSLGLTGMVAFGVVGSLMSLGAVDFGVVVDDTVVLVENVARRLRQQPAPAGPAGRAWHHQTIVEACAEVRKPMLVGLVVIIGMYLPLLGLEGVDGKMFRPLAQTVILLLLGSLVMTLLVVPALCALGLRAGGTGGEPRLLGWLRSVYEPTFGLVRRHRLLVLLVLLLLGGGAAWLLPRLGADFMPALDEGWLVVEVQRDPKISLTESVKQEKATERAIREEVPEVKDLFARIGMSAIATDPQGANENDIYISFQPRSVWRTPNGLRLTKAELSDLIKEVINRRVPGQDLALNQPIAVRFDELLEGVRTDVAVKLYGEDFDQLDGLADQVAALARQVPGAGEVVIDRTGRTDTLEFRPDRLAMLSYMATADQVNTAISTALQGREVGRIDEGEQYYPLVVRLSDEDRANPDVLNIIPFRAADGTVVLALGNIGHWEKVPHVTAITREAGRRREAVLITVDNGNAQGFARQLESLTKSKVPLPAGYRLELAGAFKNLQTGTDRLLLLGLVVLALSAGLVYYTLGSWRQTGLVALGIPFALMGGVYGLGLRGLPLTMPAAVGLVALGGLSILNGLVMIACFNQMRARGLAAGAAARESARVRLRPVLMTALVAGAGFVPMAVSTSAGAEIQRPLATVVIAGVISATILTLLVVPALLEWMHQPKDAGEGERAKAG
jgi:cobalt-zinc-cadmium resistance protein CzcA